LNRDAAMTLFDVNYRLLGMSPQELREELYWLTERLYNDDCTQISTTRIPREDEAIPAASVGL
jgi:hypothetical protein